MKKATKPKTTTSCNPKTRGNKTSNSNTGPTTSVESKSDTKKNILINLLKRPKGATAQQLMAATGWQQHSVRGFLSGTVKKKLGHTVQSRKIDQGERRYRIIAGGK